MFSVLALLGLFSSCLWAQSNTIKLGFEMPREPSFRSMLRSFVGYEQRILPRFSCELGFSLGTQAYKGWYYTRDYDLGLRLSPRFYLWQANDGGTGMYVGPAFAIDQLRIRDLKAKTNLSVLTFWGAGLMAGIQARIYKRFSIQNQFMVTKRFHYERKMPPSNVDYWPPSLKGLRLSFFASINYSIGRTNKKSDNSKTK